MGSWMFAWAEALHTAGVRTVVVAVTSRVAGPVRTVHAPTRTAMYLLPPPTLHRRVAPHMARRGLEGRRDPSSIGAAMLAQVAPYLSTPPRALRGILRAEGCTAVVCQEYETPRFDVCVALGRLLGIPVYATFQGGDYQSTHLERYVRPHSIRRAAGVVVAGVTETRRLQDRYGLPPARIARIFNPVDTSFWHAEDRAAARAALSLAAGEEVVVWHGQLHPRKGVDVLLRAWARVRAERPGRALRLLLVGAGEQSGRDLVGPNAAADGVELVEEWVTDRARIRRYLSAGDVYAFPSRHEGFPVAPIEAMACGLPVVAADAQGVRDIFEHGERDGGVVVPRDDVDALARALGSLLDDPERRLELARNARRRIDDAFALVPVGLQLRAFLTRDDHA